MRIAASFATPEFALPFLRLFGDSDETEARFTEQLQRASRPIAGETITVIDRYEDEKTKEIKYGHMRFMGTETYPFEPAWKTRALSRVYRVIERSGLYLMPMQIAERDRKRAAEAAAEATARLLREGRSTREINRKTEKERKEMERLLRAPVPRGLDRYYGPLTENEQDYVTLRFGHDWKVARIARAMGKDRSTIKESLDNAMRKIKQRSGTHQGTRSDWDEDLIAKIDGEKAKGGRRHAK